MLGDRRTLSPHLRQLILNPLRRHAQAARSIHNPDFLETLRELADRYAQVETGPPLHIKRRVLDTLSLKVYAAENGRLTARGTITDSAITLALDLPTGSQSNIETIVTIPAAGEAEPEDLARAIFAQSS